MGSLSKLSHQQEELKGRIIYLMTTPDLPYDEAVLKSLVATQPIEEVVNCALIHSQMDGRPADDHDIAWASQFLDHLDTIGWTIRPKNKRARGRLPSVPKVQPISGEG